LLNCIMVNQDC